MTDFRAWGAIMGPTGLTAVFGMGTGVAPSAWPPEKRPAEVFRSAGRVGFKTLGQAASRCGGERRSTRHLLKQESFAGPKEVRATHLVDRRLPPWRGADRGGQAARLLGPVG